MMHSNYPRHFPGSYGDWMHVLLRWLFANVFLGSIALLISLFVAAMSNEPFALPQDFVLAATVLAMTIAATSADGLGESENGRLRTKAWLHRITLMVIITGSLLALIKTPSGLLLGQKVNSEAALLASLSLLLIAAIVGVLAHLEQLRGRDELVRKVIEITVASLNQNEEYANQQRHMMETIQSLAAGAAAHDGTRL